MHGTGVIRPIVLPTWEQGGAESGGQLPRFLFRCWTHDTVQNERGEIEEVDCHPVDFRKVSAVYGGERSKQYSPDSSVSTVVRVRGKP